MNLQEFKIQCLEAGFIEVDDPVVMFKYDLAESMEDQDLYHPPRLIFQVINGMGHFCFSSGLGYETIHLNTLDPKKVIEFGKLISSIEPHF